jgi:hypothetical protein
VISTAKSSTLEIDVDKRKLKIIVIVLMQKTMRKKFNI